MKMLDSEEEMLAADYRIPMSIGECPHAEVNTLHSIMLMDCVVG